MGSLRLLPILIVAATLMLSVRLGDIWFGLQDGSISVAQAAEEADTRGGEEEDDHLDDGRAGDGHSDADDTADSVGNDDGAFSIDELTLEEIEVLQELAVRRSALEQLERELNLREGLLNAAEQRIELKINEMQSLRDKIGVLIRQYDDQEDAELQSVVKIYETMKPKDAARILQEMDLTILLSIMEQMKERSSAPILAAMDGSTARVITSELARRRAIDPPAG